MHIIHIAICSCKCSVSCTGGKELFMCTLFTCSCTCSVSCTGGKELDSEEENLGLAGTRKTAIPGVYFRQYLPVSNKVRDL